MDQDGLFANLANDVAAGRFAEVRERVASAVENRIHVRHGMNAVTASAVSRCFADSVNALVTYLARFHELLLDQETPIKPMPGFVRSPHGHALLVAEHFFNRDVQIQIRALFDAKPPRFNLQGRGEPADGVGFDGRRRSAGLIGDLDHRAPAVTKTRDLWRALGPKN